LRDCEKYKILPSGYLFPIERLPHIQIRGFTSCSSLLGIKENRNSTRHIMYTIKDSTTIIIIIIIIIIIKLLLLLLLLILPPPPPPPPP
jgi:hypothetical protein